MKFFDDCYRDVQNYFQSQQNFTVKEVVSCAFMAGISAYFLMTSPLTVLLAAVIACAFLYGLNPARGDQFIADRKPQAEAFVDGAMDFFGLN